MNDPLWVGPDIYLCYIQRANIFMDGVWNGSKLIYIELRL
jgi:hypothetical protein